MNWTNIITKLSDAGVTQKEIAQHCGCGQSTISEILRGEIKNPAYSIGSKLISLCEEKVGFSGTAPEPERRAA